MAQTIAGSQFHFLTAQESHTLVCSLGLTSEHDQRPVLFRRLLLLLLLQLTYIERVQQ